MTTRRSDEVAQDAQSEHDADAAEQYDLGDLAAGHCDLLRAYFGLQAYGGLLLGGFWLLSLIIGNHVTMHGQPWVALPLAAVNTWGAFRTRRLLGEGDLEGVWMAAGMLGCTFLAAVATGHPGIGAIFSAIGLILTGSVWRGIRAARIAPPASRHAAW